jgi:predicted TIM-barrel fold metal-dependent hydrolase
VTAKDLVALLDAAGIKRAVVLSTAYIYEQPSRKIDNAADKVRADNDWTSQQVAQYPDRLVGFCGPQSAEGLRARRTRALRKGSQPAQRAQAALR